MDLERAEVLLREYETLRRESLDSITHRTQVASLGLAAIGAFFAAPFLSGGDLRSSRLVLAVLAVGVPLMSVLVLHMWLGEFERMERVGSYLCWLEHRINDCFGEHLLTWESWLSDQTHHHGVRLAYPYYAVAALFTLIGLGAPVAGALAARPSLFEWLLVIPGMAAALVAGAHAGRRIHHSRLRVDEAVIASWFREHQEAIVTG